MRLALTAVASLARSPGRASPAASPVAVAVRPRSGRCWPTPAGTGSMAPQITSEGARAILSWIEGAGPATALKFAERTATGWSTVRVVASGDQLMANSADVPSVMALGPRRWSLPGWRRTARIPRRTTSGCPGRPTMGAHGRSRSARTTTAPRPSTGSSRCSRSPAAASVSSGSMAARFRPRRPARACRCVPRPTLRDRTPYRRARRWSTRACVIVVLCRRRPHRTA